MKNKIKVLMLANFPLGDMKGGVAVHTAKLIKSISELSDEEIDFYLISFGNKSCLFNKGNVKIKIIKSHKLYYIFPFVALLRLRCEAIKINPQIIHVQGSNVSPYLLYSLLVRSHIVKIVTVHGLVQIESMYSKPHKNSIFKFLYVLLEKYALKNISEIIVCSPQMEYLIRGMTNSRIHVIPNGIDIEHFNKSQMNYPICHPSIFFVGMLKKVKGVEILLKAMQIVLNRISKAHLYIAGTGPQESELKKIAEKLNIMNNVTFLGFVSEDYKYSLYKSTDISVFPSLYEPFGIVLLEAMVCGKAVVASNVGGIPSIVDNGNTGLLFESGNSQELAQKIILLLEDKNLRERLGENGLKKAQQFKWENIAIKTFDLYKYLNKQLS